MWKLFEKALGRTETEEPALDSRQSKQDSGLQRPGSAGEARESGSGNGGAASAARDEMRSGAMREDATRGDATRGKKTGAEPAAGNTPQASPDEPQPAANPASGAAAGTDPDLESKIKAAMRTVYDPEIPINIYELGLVYGLQIEPEGKVRVQMTLTAPSCPEAQTLPARVQQVIQEVPGVSEAAVELVWEPTWTPQKMSEAARLQLGIF